MPRFGPVRLRFRGSTLPHCNLRPWLLDLTKQICITSVSHFPLCVMVPQARRLTARPPPVGEHGRAWQGAKRYPLAGDRNRRSSQHQPTQPSDRKTMKDEQCKEPLGAARKPRPKPQAEMKANVNRQCAPIAANGFRPSYATRLGRPCGFWPSNNSQFPSPANSLQRNLKTDQGAKI